MSETFGTPEQARRAEAVTKRDGEAPECPIQPLGHRAGNYYFISKAGEVRRLNEQTLNERGITSLVGGSEGAAWLRSVAPATNRDGEVTGWSPKAAMAHLVALCWEKGLFDPAVPVRGPGVWLGKDGRLVVHCGDRLLIGSEWVPPGRLADGTIYAGAPPMAPPADTPADAATGRKLLKAFALWTYESELAPEILLGFLGTAMLGGAPAFRPHMLTVGARGSGKTWLSNLVAAGLGAGAFQANEFTEAGMRQQMTGQARTFILDETEEFGAIKIDKVVQLLRRAASGEGARVLRGSAGGEAQMFSVTGCAYLAAILPPVLKPQDRSRINVVHLKPLPMGDDAIGAAERVLEAIAWAAQISPALRRRAIDGWPRFLATFAVYRARLIDLGCDGRDADRIASLLAGRDLLTQDEVPDPQAVPDEVDRFLELIQDAEEQEDEGEGHQCLVCLCTSSADTWHAGERKVVADLIMNARDSQGDGHSCRKALGRIGLRLENNHDPDNRYLLVANRHVGLERIFKDTRWGNGSWVQALRYLPGARPWHRPVRFAGVQSRAIAVPDSVLPREKDGEGEETEM